ncbi:ShlB/FhaC/HecB family hemolysin secretion/activation protein [Falsiroseomonas selenitidurans]|uniref:ShlB/FhaC/HecB family hemolysin secretion/activation protein n=1 Tax=Falsiroseomonas selenitidurans TaxID=2716335 RepID=A0ABX1E6L9_9PROT|nr:ShlB/FhaC/HecB family hemolysin secretion/activation protein [Falsiroseomonas selenitidurans]NKC32837.1 ShlB/FhaC/HecB family hemolysin secretion/activation protein [Falsiroseomonas selenitidurans]
MLRPRLFALLLPVLAMPALAQVPAPPPLSPGQIERVAPTPPPALAPSLRPALPQPAEGPGAALRVRITGLRITGNEALPEAPLRALLAPLVGQEVPLAAIEDARIAAISAYGQAGYPFVTASAGLVPEAGGSVLVLSVIEGRIESVKLDGDIGPAGTQVLRFLAPLAGSGPVRTAALERALLLAGDVPGVIVRSVVRPLEGGSSGALELVARVSRRAVSGYLSVDNRGYRLTGPLQGLLAVGANSFTSMGERVEALLFQSQDYEQTLGQVSAEAFLGGSGLRMRLYAGYGVTRPGSFLAQLGYDGTALLAGVGASYPIIRTRPLNLYTALQFDMLDSEVEVGTPGRRQSLDQSRVLRFGFEGQSLDSLLAFAPEAAVTTANLRVHQGTDWLGASDSAATPGRVGSDFGFTKWTAELSRSQPVAMLAEGLMFSVYGLVGGQRSDDVLPLSEKFLFGGNRLGRGFYAGQVTGDTAFGASGELRLDVRPAPFRIPGLGEGDATVQPSAQFYLFRDFGQTFENLTTDPDRTVESWGGGVRLFLAEGIQLDIEAVQRLTRQVDAAGSSVKPLSETAGFFRLLTRF